MKRLLIACACLLLLTASFPCQASGKDELTFSANLFNGKTGPTVYEANTEFLVGLTKSLYAGPSVGFWDAGDTDGGRVGVAGKLRIGDGGGFFVRAAAHKLTGDAADVADYTGEVGAGIDVGGPHAFAEFQALQRWSRSSTGEISDPEGTAFTAGLVLRLGK